MIETLVSLVAVLLGSTATVITISLLVQFTNNTSRNMSLTNTQATNDISNSNTP